MAITTYESPFPSGYMTQNIQAERRESSPETVAGARDYNRHDVEILRLQEVLGMRPANTGQAYPTGAAGVDITTIVYNNYEDVQNIFTSGALSANKLPFHDDQADGNYQFVQWFLQWMGIWDNLVAEDAAIGAPSITNVMKAVIQNKYDLEVLFEPEFMTFADRYNMAGVGNYFEYTADGTESFFAGYLNANPKKPIGGACNLNIRPYPVYDAYCVTCSGFVQGRATLTSGHVIRFTDFATGGAPPASGNLQDSDHKIGLFGNSPYEFVAQPSGYVMDSSGLWPYYTGVPPEPLPPPPHGGPGPIPGPPGGGGTAYPGPPADPIIDIDTSGYVPPADWDQPGDNEPVEADTIQYREPWQVIHDDNGNVAVGDPEIMSHTPTPYSDTTKWTQVTGLTMYGVNLADDAGVVTIPMYKGCWILATAVLAVGTDGPQSTDDLKTYYRKLTANEGVEQSVPAEKTWGMVNETIAASKIKTVPIGYFQCEDAGTIYMIVSDEGVSAGNVFLLSVQTQIVGTG